MAQVVTAKQNSGLKVANEIICPLEVSNEITSTTEVWNEMESVV